MLSFKYIDIRNFFISDFYNLKKNIETLLCLVIQSDLWKGFLIGCSKVPMYTLSDSSHVFQRNKQMFLVYYRLKNLHSEPEECRKEKNTMTVLKEQMM